MDNQKGLWDKYIITKSSGKPLADGFYAIVLRIDGGRYLKACREGVKTFADYVRDENPELADDLEEKIWQLELDCLEKAALKQPKGSFLNP